MTRGRRCAIYTRKSTEEGLEQDFNSLDAQREACEAYIKSQAGEGWRVLRDRYDDGGYSGGTLQRPALERLLADIHKGKIDTVVVYKVDRLTRSLSDFAKIVDVFDAQGVAFVSVTQQFNTTSSMGRLTLNMLLSFAQFEREVTGERIRDKIAASKKKGMWMGGRVPLGYDVENRKLVVNEAEAATVRELFRLYLDCGNVNALREKAHTRGYVSKQRQAADGRQTGGQSFTRGHLYQLLRNPIYVGQVPHKDVRYPGQHDAIIDQATFEAVQQQLAGNAMQRRTAKNVKAPSLLTGLIYDETGARLCPTHANKQGRRYRYYISKHLMHGAKGQREGWRLPAKDLEQAVVRALQNFLSDQRGLLDVFDLDGAAPSRCQQAIDAAVQIAEKVDSQEVLEKVLHRATLSPDNLRIDMKRLDLEQLLLGEKAACDDAGDSLIAHSVPVHFRRRGVEMKLVLPGSDAEGTNVDAKLITLIARAHCWFDQLARRELGSVRELAIAHNCDPSDVGRELQLAFLAPDIVEDILAGRQPLSLTPRRLRRIGALPVDWHQQRQLLGFEA